VITTCSQVQESLILDGSDVLFWTCVSIWIYCNVSTPVFIKVLFILLAYTHFGDRLLVISWQD
jgi:hypothetical protein